ncbi:MAG: Uma2 family endonuclease [Gemmatimonadetes bacterium]|nr:Uma2 family endonuclease [Gemmatimonadota bacterium]
MSTESGEVHSESTEGYDRGEKFAHFRRLETLREYVLIAQQTRRVELYVRQSEHWVFSEISDAAGAPAWRQRPMRPVSPSSEHVRASRAPRTAIRHRSVALASHCRPQS